jgi:hypothetical protein
MKPQRNRSLRFVPGHGNLGGIEIASAVREYFVAVQNIVKKTSKEKRTPEEIVSKAKPEVLASYPTWEHPRFIDPAILCAPTAL